VHHLPREVLRDGESEHVRGSSRVGDDPAHLSAGETARLNPNPKHDLVAVDGVNVEMDGHSTAAPLPWSGMRGQYCLKHRRPHGVPPACHIKRELRGKAPHTGGAGALPLRPHQAQCRPGSAPPGECVKTFISSGQVLSVC
jgi:hypothetical protein